VTSRNITIFSVLFISVTIWILHLLFILSRAQTMPLWSCIVDFVFRVCKILIDSYVLVTFLDLQSFFITQKSVQLEIRDQKLTSFNKFIVIWTIILVASNFIHSLTNIIYNSYFKYHSILSENQGYIFFSQFFS